MLAVASDGVTEMLVSVGWPAPQPSKRSAADSRGKTESLRLIFMVFAPRVRCCLKALHASPAQASIRRPERAIGLACLIQCAVKRRWFSAGESPARELVRSAR